MEMKLNYTYWKDDSWLVGFLDDFPGWWTQGKNIAELEDMLLDLYDLCDDEETLRSAKLPSNDIPAKVSHGVLKIHLAVTA
jgi:predicted RNase H-like HicB family nuclease